MNTKAVRLLLVAALAASVVGCALPLPSAGPGVIYTGAKEGISVNNDVPMNKNGEACSVNILGIVTFGDASVEEAKQDARIARVATIDRSYFGILGVFAKACTLISGD